MSNKNNFVTLNSTLKMVVFKFYCLLLIVLCDSKKSLVPQAILQLVKSHYGESSVIIEVFYNSDRLKVLDETLALLSGVKRLKITKVDAATRIDKSENAFNDAIFLFDNYNNFLEIYPKLDSIENQNLRREINLLLFCEDSTRENILKNITKATFLTFLFDENNKIALNAMTMYTEKRCNVPQLVEINRYSSEEQKWMTEKFFVPKWENLHGCELLIHLKDDNFPFSDCMYSEDEDSECVFEGVLVGMIKALSSSLNFTYSFTLDPRTDEADLYLDSSPLLNRTFKIFSLSDPIYSASNIIIVPPGKPFTPWEKLFMPFDRETWMWLAATFMIAFFVIFLIKLSKSASMKDFIIGLNVTTPTLNVIAIFMGIGQLFLPQRNIARFLFTNFLIFCLIMRTAYQGKYFEFITTDLRRKPISSFEELRKEIPTLYVELSESNYEIDSSIFSGYLKLN